MPYKIASWNINSVRLRMPLIQKLTHISAPDILCLQETKVMDDLFPLTDIEALGYQHTYFHGQKSYNGVAILSKLPLTNIHSIAILDHPDARHIAGTLPDGIEVHNFYVPAGGDIPDRIENPYYGFKLDYVNAMHGWFTKERQEKTKMILVGDLNIAPGEHDVWSHKQLLKVVSHTPDEITQLERCYTAGDWVDTARHFTPDTEKLYSWWSYRNKDWKKSNRGRRLDHIWITKDMLPRLQLSETFVDARDWERPSDHVPVLAQLA